MIRKLFLPALAAVLLGGCVTSGYQYRDGTGDYYYGQPSTQYRYYGSPYGSYGYGYSSGWSGSIGYGYGYYPYGYSGYYGYPRYRQRYPYRPGRGHNQGHDGDNDHHGDHSDRSRPPWRDLGDLRTRRSGTSVITRQPRATTAPMTRPAPRTTTAPMARPAARSGGSRVGGRRRSR